MSHEHDNPPTEMTTFRVTASRRVLTQELQADNETDAIALAKHRPNDWRQCRIEWHYAVERVPSEILAVKR